MVATNPDSLLTGYVAAVATASWSTIEGTLMVYYSYCINGTSVTVGATYPQSILNGTLACSTFSGHYETLVGGIWMCN